MKPHIPGTRYRKERLRLLADARFEILPLRDAETRVDQLPTGTTVTVTASPRRGIDATVALTESLAARGYAAVPHLAARQFIDEAQLHDVLSRLERAGVADIFVVGGDAATPAGMFGDGLDLLKAIDARGREFARVGVPAYPEGHPAIDDETLWQTLVSKQAYADYIVTQMCFDADTISRFVLAARERGVTLPIVAGIPGVVGAAKLVRTGARIGVGDSLRFVRGNRAILRRLFGAPYRPEALVRKLAAHQVDGFAEPGEEQYVLDAARGRWSPRPKPVPALHGLHIYTFNEVAATLRSLEHLDWRESGAAAEHEGKGMR
ncbi:methylenetetrahydrofolate reductase [Phytoactinopolyspora halotolerans]|uniref:Methylenetetrahydrofolate reductase n=1 Tax=Phytoactinopolyspora halotolerans TaxID=1981512 RepID=A0A6L9SCE4_9ACTN|nr:methylenetetrahydrofolate reductase [Phytoactinopolyspora halotolerans]NEE02354.1 methylenetetrahydrofolate reductase [Phytoactinopolyspora halotolerans]